MVFKPDREPTCFLLLVLISPYCSVCFARSKMRSWTGLCAFLACSLSWSLLGADAFLPAALQRPQSAHGSRRGSVQMASRAGRDGWDRQQALSAATMWSVAALGLGPQLFVEKAQAAVGEGRPL